MAGDQDFLAERFEEQRVRLRAVAYRMLGSASEADDAVQEAWLRLDRADAGAIDNLSAWLTTVVARVCLNMLRSRSTRREVPLESDQGPAAADAAEAERWSSAALGAEGPAGLGAGGVGGLGGGGSVRLGAGGAAGYADPEQEAVLADSVGLAMLVVLDALAPAERLAFVLHDLFGVPFEEIAPMIDRTPVAARQLASRARRRVRGAPEPPGDRARQRRIVEAYLAAARDGDFDALVAVLDPEVVLHADAAASPSGRPGVLRGAAQVTQGALAASARARFTGVALVDGAPGLVMVVGGRLRVALAFRFAGDRVTELDVIADPERLRDVPVAVLD